MVVIKSKLGQCYTVRPELEPEAAARGEVAGGAPGWREQAAAGWAAGWAGRLHCNPLLASLGSRMVVGQWAAAASTALQDGASAPATMGPAQLEAAVMAAPLHDARVRREALELPCRVAFFRCAAGDAADAAQAQLLADFLRYGPA